VFPHLKSGDIWARAYYYLPSSTNLDMFVSTLQMAELEPPEFGCSLRIRSNDVELHGVMTMPRAMAPFPREQWTCVEFHIQIDASAGICEAFVGGVIAAQSPLVKTLPAMGYTTLDIGILSTEPAQGPVEIFVDDVAAGITRVGCE
jgi:hypothetical protein